MKNTIQEFQKFIAKGNVIDMAVGVIIGGAFGKIVTSLVSDIIMPPIGLILGRVNFADLYISLSGQTYASLAEAQKAGAPTLNYGTFINNIINFLIIAFCVFLIVKQATGLQKKFEKPAASAGPTTKECPQCMSVVPLRALRCAHCTSEFAGAK